jgi:hypothetical protein
MMIHARLYNFSREMSYPHHCASTMLIALHSLIDIMCCYAPSVHSNAYYILKLLLLGCLVPICLRLATSQYISLKFMAKLVQSIDLHSVHKHPQAIKILHHNANTVIRFGSWSLAVCWLTPKIIDLSSDLILCARLMLSYLESRFSKVGVIIVQQGSLILLLYQRNQFGCRWA